jgi:hypothetical protein
MVQSCLILYRELSSLSVAHWLSYYLHDRWMGVDCLFCRPLYLLCAYPRTPLFTAKLQRPYCAGIMDTHAFREMLGHSISRLIRFRCMPTLICSFSGKFPFPFETDILGQLYASSIKKSFEMTTHCQTPLSNMTIMLLPFGTVSLGASVYYWFRWQNPFWYGWEKRSLFLATFIVTSLSREFSVLDPALSKSHVSLLEKRLRIS